MRRRADLGRRKAQLKATRRRPVRDETEPGYRSGLSLELMRPSPPRGRSTCGLPHNWRASRNTEPDNRRETAPHSSEFRHYTAYPGLNKKCKAGSHLGSTLNPGGAVLTLGVSRRSGSVAYIRVDASPNEVLTPSMMPEHSARVNSPRRLALTSRYGSVTRPGSSRVATHSSPARR